jgi:hypothetical protein
MAFDDAAAFKSIGGTRQRFRRGKSPEKASGGVIVGPGPVRYGGPKRAWWLCRRPGPEAGPGR